MRSLATGGFWAVLGSGFWGASPPWLLHTMGWQAPLAPAPAPAPRPAGHLGSAAHPSACGAYFASLSTSAPLYREPAPTLQPCRACLACVRPAKRIPICLLPCSLAECHFPLLVSLFPLARFSRRKTTQSRAPESQKPKIQNTQSSESTLRGCCLEWILRPPEQAFLPSSSFTLCSACPSACPAPAPSTSRL